MKISALLTFLAAGIMMTSFQSAAIGPLAGSSNTEFGDYLLKSSDVKIEKEGVALETYTLTYENVNTPVQIIVENSKNCRNYTVKYPSFEVLYVCNKRGLGAKRVDINSETVNPLVVKALLDEKQLAYQERIVSEHQSEEEALQLIACYFPNLIRKDIRSLD